MMEKVGNPSTKSVRGSIVEAYFRFRGIAIPVNIHHIARLRVDRSVINTAQQRVDGAELRPRLRAVGISDDDARRATIEAPCVTTVSGAVEHVVDVL